MPHTLGTAGQGRDGAGCAGHPARQGEQQRCPPVSFLTQPWTASGEGQGKKRAGEPLTWPSKHWWGEPLNLSAAALSLEIPSWLAHVALGEGRHMGLPGIPGHAPASGTHGWI